ncbi:hypothetical protein C0966_01390 [Bacillus methanolicus]|nr:hypothetical protein [Bacillus methanolicus]
MDRGEDIKSSPQHLTDRNDNLNMYTNAGIIMYKIDFRFHTNHEVVSMYISINVETDFEIKSLEDLPKLKQLMEHVYCKIEMAQIAK